MPDDNQQQGAGPAEAASVGGEVAAGDVGRGRRDTWAEEEVEEKRETEGGLENKRDFGGYFRIGRGRAFQRGGMVV